MTAAMIARAIAAEREAIVRDLLTQQGIEVESMRECGAMGHSGEAYQHRANALADAITAIRARGAAPGVPAPQTEARTA